MGRIFFDNQYVFVQSASWSPFQSNPHNSKLWETYCWFHSVNEGCQYCYVDYPNPLGWHITVYYITFLTYTYNVGTPPRQIDHWFFLLHITRYTSNFGLQVVIFSFPFSSHFWWLGFWGLIVGVSCWVFGVRVFSW